MKGNFTRSLSSNSTLISRLDHLDSMVSNLEGKRCSSSARWASDDGPTSVVGLVKRECVPLDLAVKEAQSKGSILDRLTSLEDRLIQICLDIESEAASPSSSKNSRNSTSPRKSGKSFLHSFTRFRHSNRNHNNQEQLAPQVSLDKFQVTKQKEQHSEAEHSSEVKHSRKTTKDEKASSKQKKFSPSNMLHSRLLGC